MITVYSKPGCQGCRLTKKALDRADVIFTARDVAEDEGAAAEVDQILRDHPEIKAFPIVVGIGDAPFGGHNPDKLSLAISE